MVRNLLKALVAGLLLTPFAASAAITSVTNNGTSNVSATSLTMIESGVQQQNDLIVVECQAVETGTLVWTDPADFTEIDQVETTAGSPTLVSYLGYKKRGATAGDALTFSHGDAASNIACAQYWFRGVNTTTPFDVAYVRANHYKQGATNVFNMTPEDITTATNGAWVLLLNGVTQKIDGAAGAPSGYTIDAGADRLTSAGVNRGIVLARKEKATAGLETPGAWTHTSTLTNSDPFTYTLALRPSGATAAAFTAGPTLGTPTTSMLPVTFTSDTAGTVKGVACADGNLGNAANTLAGLCSGGSASVATFSNAVSANVADNDVFSGLAADTLYDLGFVIDATTDSPLATIANARTAANPVTGTVKFFWRAEGTTLNGTHDFSAGDTTATPVNSPSISTTAKRFGTSGLLADTTQAHYEFDSASIVNKAVGSFSCWTQWKVAVPNAGVSGCMEFRNSADANMEISINPAASQEFRLRLKSASGVALDLETTSVNASVDAWYYIVAHYKISTDDRRLEVYDSNLNLIQAVEDLTTDLAAYEPATINEIWLGNTGTFATGLWADNFFISDDYNAPLGAFGNITSFEPTFTALSAGTISSTAINVNITSDQDSTIVGVACPDGQTASRAQVLAHNCSGGAAADFFEKLVSGGVAASDVLNGLSNATTYDLFFEQTSAIGGPGQAQGSLANQTTGGSGGTNPVFDSGPSVLSRSSQAYVIQYDASAAANDIFCGAYLLDATAPTATQVENGTNAHGTATEATTGSADTITLNPDDADVLPGYDLYCIVKKTSGAVRSAVAPMLDEFLDPPSGRQYVTVTGAPGTGELGLLDDASPAAAVGDIIDAPTLTDSFEQGTFAHVLTVNGDTTYVVKITHDASNSPLPAPDRSRQSVARRFYDRSLGAWSDAAGVRYFLNNNKPRFVGRQDAETNNPFLFEKNAPLSEDLDSWWTDDEGDALTNTIVNVPPGGTVVGSEFLTGAFTTLGRYPTVQVKATDETTDQSSTTVEFVVGARLPPIALWLQDETLWKTRNIFEAMDAYSQLAKGVS